MIGMFLGLFKLSRPLEWSKSLFNMLVAVAVAHYALGIQIDAVTFVFGFVSLAALWSALYALNDYSDRHADAEHDVKKARPIPSGRVSAKIALWFSFALAGFSFGIAYNLNILFVVCLAVMLVNQLLYTLKPFSFKKRPVLDLISGSLVNPVFRFYSGWVLFVPAFSAPLLPLLFVAGIQFGGYGLYRLGSKQHDEKLSYRSSVAVFGEKNIKLLFYAALVLGGISFLAMPLTGILPLRFLLLALLSAFFIPAYWSTIMNPQEMDMKKIYRVTYFHALVFAAGFVLLLLFPF